MLFLATVSLIVVTNFNNAESSEGNRYELITCTGIDSEGNLFNGAQCRNLVLDGPCDKESVCYANDEEEELDPDL